MSDYEDSTVTYTALSSKFVDLPGIGSPGVDGPPVMPEDPYAYVVAAFQAPPSPDYVPGHEYPPLPDFVLEPVYPEFMPLEDEVLPTEEQLLPAAASPTADSPGYVPESDPEEDPEENDDEDLEEDPADYPVDEGNDGDDEDVSSDDDKDDDVDIEEDEKEEEHPALADSKVIPSPPLPVSSPVPVISPPSPASPIRSLGYRVAMIRLRAEAPSTFHSPPPHIILSHTRANTLPSGTPPSGTPPLIPISLPTSSPPLHLLYIDRRADIPGVTLPPRKRLGIALDPRYEVGESSHAPTARPSGGIRADYGFVA
ncbi:hypothetical protein Tco_0035034, partial [Tanacetum coccineum]